MTIAAQTVACRDVIPAKAGIQAAVRAWRFWIPAFAGMTS